MTNYIIGCDVSQFQDDSWVKSGTYKYVFVRTSFGTSITLDPHHTAHVKVARNHNLLLGHYHFLRPGNIQTQANNFVKNSGAKPGELLVCDWEAYGGTMPTCAEKDQFIKAVKKLAPKNKVLLYCDVNNWKTKDTTGYYGDGLWIASYTTSLPNITAPWIIWQYTSNGGLDKDRARFASISAMKTWANELNVSTKVTTTTATTKETVDGIELGKYYISGTKIKFRPLYHNNNVQANSTCYCVTKAVAMAEAKLKKLGVIKESLDFWQFGYGQAAAASADTHAAGGVIDTVQTDDVTWKVLREVGFTASWYRGPGAKYGNFSTKHIHAVLSGCPHVSNGAKDQISSTAQGVRHGKNGLANGAEDYAPASVKSVKYITWQDAWKKFVKEPAKPAPSTGKGIFGMSAYISHSVSKNVRKIAKANTAQWLRINDENDNVSIVFGPAKFTGQLTMTLTGLTEGEEFWYELATYDIDSKGNATKKVTHDIIRKQGTKSGIVSFTDPINGNLGKPSAGKKSRVARITVQSTKAEVAIKRMSIYGWSE